MNYVSFRYLNCFLTVLMSLIIHLISLNATAHVK